MSLRIEIVGENFGNLYLSFEGVQHIQCPVSWQGVNIYLGSEEECVEILFKLNKGFEALPESFLTEKYYLYKFQHPDFDIHVLANSIYLTTEVPLD